MDYTNTIEADNSDTSFSHVNSQSTGGVKNMTYTQIDVDFDVWKAITMRRTSPEMTENSVLRSLLGLGDGRTSEMLKSVAEPSVKLWETKGVKFPVGTEFRATYKGVEYRATIKEAGIEYDGTTYKYVSGAAHAVTGTQVNGWRFWECKRPGQRKWVLINELFKKVHRRAS